MVGVPRSTGCILCIRRRVRCDQARPSCGNCHKYGSPCPGYDRGVKFVDGKHVIRQKGPVSAASGSKSDGAASSSGVTVAAVDYNIGQWQVQGAKEHQQHAAAGGNRAGQSPGDAGLWVWDGTRREQSSPAGQDSALYPQLWDGGGGSGSGNYAPTASLAAVYPPPRQRRLDVLLFRMIRQPQEPLCRADFVRAMMEHVQLADPNHMELVVFGGWFGRVPQRLGRVIHLDSAACAFVLHLLGKMRGDANLVAASRSVYGRSLVALQRALNHPVEWRSPETLCTAFLLCLFELFNGTEPRSWMKHASAVGYLMQQRGPDAFREDWDKSMLIAFRGILIMDALFSGCECFLAKSRAWREVSRHHDMPPDATATERAYAALADTFLMLLAQLPAIVHKAYVLREANRRGTVPLGDKAGIDLADVALLVRRAARLRARFIEFGRRLTRILPFPAEVPASSVTADDDGPEERPLFDTVLSYRIVWDGALYMGYWASVVVLNTCLQECGFTTISAEGELELEEGVLLKRGDKQPPDETTAETAPQVAPGAADDISVSSPTKTSPLHHPSSPPADVAIASSAPRPAAAAAAPVDLTVQTRRMVQDILRSVDGVCQGAMGPYRIGYPLRIAYEVASVEEKEWVRARLGRISEFYAAMSPSTFPPVEPPRQFRV